MDWISKTMLTMATVAVLLTAARLFGRRVAGVLAGMPTVTGPALVWLALDQGAGFAAQAAQGSVAACALCAVFALGYVRAGRRSKPMVSAAVACGCAVAIAVPAHALRLHLGASVFVAVATCLLVLACLPASRPTREVHRPLRGEMWITVCAAGSVSALVSILAPHVGGFWSGVLASPPLVAGAIAMHLHRAHGGASTHAFLRGYVTGLIGRTAFGLAFALMIAMAGTVLALLTATGAGCLVFWSIASVAKARHRAALSGASAGCVDAVLSVASERPE